MPDAIIALPNVTATFEVNEPELSRQALPIMVRRLHSVQRQVSTAAKMAVPTDTGHLGRSHAEDPVRITSPWRVDGGVTAHADYAAAVHEGRGARVIRPRKGKALRFNIGGRIVFAKVVRQGPMRGRPWLLNAARRVVATLR